VNKACLPSTKAATYPSSAQRKTACNCTSHTCRWPLTFATSLGPHHSLPLAVGPSPQPHASGTRLVAPPSAQQRILCLPARPHCSPRGHFRKIKTMGKIDCCLLQVSYGAAPTACEGVSKMHLRTVMGRKHPKQTSPLTALHPPQRPLTHPISGDCWRGTPGCHTLKAYIFNCYIHFLLVEMFYWSMSFKPKYKTKCKRKVGIFLILQYKE